MPNSRVENDTDGFEKSRAHGVAERLVLVLLWCLWQAFRLPMLGVLMLLAPFVRIVLVGFATVGTFTAFLFEFGGTRPFPFLGMLAVCMGALAVLWLYETLMQLLTGRNR